MDKDVFNINELKKELPTIFCKFVEEKKDLLLELCKKYHEIEPRNIFYLISQKIISENPSDIGVLDAIKTLLLSWNWGYYRPRKEKARTINQDILNAYNESKPYLEKTLSDKKLETIDLGNEEMAGAVGRVFDIFANQMDPVGASKALHTIKPNLFIMWDTNIQKEYRFSPQYKPNGEDYVYFMDLSQKISKIILQEISWEKLWGEHHSQLEQSEKQLLDRFLCVETLPKMLDEANYAYTHSNLKKANK